MRESVLIKIKTKISLFISFCSHPVYKCYIPSSTKWLSQRWLFVVSRWPTVRNAVLGVKLANEPFANKGPTVVQSFAALSESCLDMLQIREVYHSRDLPFLNPTTYQRFPTNCQQSALLGESSVSLQKRRVPMDGAPWHGYHHSCGEFLLLTLCALFQTSEQQ